MFGNNNCCFIIIILILIVCCCGGGNSFGNSFGGYGRSGGCGCNNGF